MLLAFLQAHLQAFPDVKPVSPLVVYLPAFPPQQNIDSPVSKPRPALRDISNPEFQRRLVLGAALVIVRAAIQAHQCTRAARTGLVGLSEIIHQRSLPAR